MISRHRFVIDTDTGTQTLLSAPVMGAILQTHWDPATGDTGGDLHIQLRNADDTGVQVVVAGDHDCLGSRFTKVYKQQTHDTGGAISSEEFVFAAGERLRVHVIPGGAAVVGKLYVWVG